VPDLQLGPNVGEQDSEDENLCMVLECEAVVVSLCRFLEHQVDGVKVHRVIEALLGTRVIEGVHPLLGVMFGDATHPELEVEDVREDNPLAADYMRDEEDGVTIGDGLECEGRLVESVHEVEVLGFQREAQVTYVLVLGGGRPELRAMRHLLRLTTLHGQVGSIVKSGLNTGSRSPTFLGCLLPSSSLPGVVN